MSSRRAFVTGMAAAMAAPLVIYAQQPKTRRIGYLAVFPISDPPSPERAAFFAGLRELGYDARRNLVIVYRSAENDLERLPELAAELVKERVELIVVVGVEAAAAAKAATTTLPVIVTTAGDPVHSGLVKSYAHPGGNVTGLSFISPEMGAKRVELIKEILPRAERVAVLWNARESVPDREWQAAREAASRLGMGIDPLPIRATDDLARALEALPRTRPHALLVIVDTRMVGFRKIIADAAIKARVPCVAGWREYVTSGALASYAPDFRALFHRAAYYVDRILRGAKPADLPVEQPSKFELIVNLKTAKALGLEIPKSVLFRADEVIE